MTDVHVSIQWKNATVFAGEEVECKIIFKNVSQTPALHRSLSPQSSQRERWKETLPTHHAQLSPALTRKTLTSAAQSIEAEASHRSAQSLNTPNGTRTFPHIQDIAPRASSSANPSHRRSLSIVTIGGDVVEDKTLHSLPLNFRRPGHGHGHNRAASLQAVPRSNGSINADRSSTFRNDRSFTVPSPFFRPSTTFVEEGVGPHSTTRSYPQSTPINGPNGPMKSKRQSSPFAKYKFSQAPAIRMGRSTREASTHSTDRPPIAKGSALSPRPHEHMNRLDQLSPVTRILSPGSADGTPRSSGDFYSMSNNSTETLASEYTAQDTSRLIHRPAHSPQTLPLRPNRIHKPELLMMGYAQIMGSFTLDGSLVNQAPFEEVKRKGVVGDQGGGGVVRPQASKRDSGILGSLGWGDIGKSFGGLLGSNELSSIKDSKSINSAKSIPILSTPQSVLFVDLQLRPGQSKSYTYRYILPKGIPPTHKGRAIKVSYNLVVGTQRVSNGSQRSQVQRADIPFKVMTSVNGHGDILGHNLMSPHIILSDNALISSEQNPKPYEDSMMDPLSSGKPNLSSPSFRSYVENLLEAPRRNSGGGLLSPVDDGSKSPVPLVKEQSTIKQSIDLAILRSNASTTSKQSANRFEINRSGERVAVIMLARPAFRLGETIVAAVDFQDSDVSCYSLHATLETSEIIDPTIALRSKTSVHRVTRRIHASQFKNTISAGRVLFSPMIPINGTPEFITSGVNLEWRLRFEFVTSRLDDTDDLEDCFDGLMEEVAQDERGIVKAAVQGLPCENFDVTVSLRVYGATTALDEKTEAGDFPI